MARSAAAAMMVRKLLLPVVASMTWLPSAMGSSYEGMCSPQHMGVEACGSYDQGEYECLQQGCCWNTDPLAYTSCVSPKQWPACEQYVPRYEREECGWVGIPRWMCEDKGCCWQGLSPDLNYTEPWCYKPAPLVHESKCQLESYESFYDCGYSGVHKAGCEARGCCWMEYAVEGRPQCYMPAQTDICTIDMAAREDCGGASNWQDCAARGCCIAREPNPNYWCYKSTQYGIDDGYGGSGGGGGGGGQEDCSTLMQPVTITNTPLQITRDPNKAQFMCPTEDGKSEVQTTQSLSCPQYAALKERFHKLFFVLGHNCNSANCHRADWVGCLLRFAGHDFMDFRPGMGGGSDGCIDNEHPDNMGLPDCLEGAEFGETFSILKQWVMPTDVELNDDGIGRPCHFMSLADFMVFMSEEAMRITRPQTAPDGSVAERLHLFPFKWGRTTRATCEMDTHPFCGNLMPDPDQGCLEVNRVFERNMGLTREESVAMMGVHSLGRARIPNSGFDGAWVSATESKDFNNVYYVSILANGWKKETTSSGRVQWIRSDTDKHTTDGSGIGDTGKEMMLHTDLCFAYVDEVNSPVNPSFTIAELWDPRNLTHECCAWRAPFGLTHLGLPAHEDPDFDISSAYFQHNGGRFCGKDLTTASPNDFGLEKDRILCCGGADDRDCGDVTMFQMGAHPEYARATSRFARDESLWLAAFRTAWDKAVTNGYAPGELTPVDTQCVPANRMD